MDKIYGKPSIIFDDYWRFASMRHGLFLERHYAIDPSIPADEIVKAHKFTNAYRVLDRVSQYMLRRVIYSPRTRDMRDLIIRVLFFKMFNKPSTWEAVENRCGAIQHDTIDAPFVIDALNAEKAAGNAIFSSAYMMPDMPQFNCRTKHANYVEFLQEIDRGNLHIAISAAESLKDIYETLRSYQGFGDFLAFQFAIDLNYGQFTDFEESDFVVPGPGAVDGVLKCFPSLSRFKPASLRGAVTDLIMEISACQTSQFEERSIDPVTLFGRPLMPIDCQNLFCEIDKYSRVAHPETAGRRTKIKSKYTRNDQSFEPMLPPKWGISLPHPALKSRPSRSQP